MRNDLSFVLRFLFLLSTRIFLSSRFSSLGQRVQCGGSMSIVMRPTQFTAVYLTKNLFAAKKRIYFFTYKNIILFKSDAFSLVSGVLAWSLYILIGQLATILE